MSTRGQVKRGAFKTLGGFASEALRLFVPGDKEVDNCNGSVQNPMCNLVKRRLASPVALRHVPIQGLDAVCLQLCEINVVLVPQRTEAPP